MYPWRVNCEDINSKLVEIASVADGDSRIVLATFVVADLKAEV